MSGQLEQVIATIRDLILTGDLEPGGRVAEIPLAERLGVSRTPVRHALTLLEKEGLLEPSGTRGFVVRQFRYEDIADAIEVRGTLEGLAARLVAEHGMTRGLQRDLEACLADGDAIIARGPDDDYLGDFAIMNERFHGLIVEAAGNQALTNALALNDGLPFAAASAVAVDRTAESGADQDLAMAQMQHRLIVDALIAGEGARAEALMKEHAQLAKRNLRALAREDGADAAGLRLVAG